MSCRRHATRPTIALWLLIAVADVTLLLGNIGVRIVLFAAGAAAVVAALTVGGWLLVNHRQPGFSVRRLLPTRQVDSAIHAPGRVRR